MDLQLCKEGGPADLDRDWWAERKLDGVRAYSKDGDLYTRKDNRITHQFPEIDVPAGTFDGELVTADMCFESILTRVQLEDRFKIELLIDQNPAYFVAFDVLETPEGDDCRDDPLRDRRDRLDQADLPENVTANTYTEEPRDLWDTVQEKDWEGVVLKDPESTYQGERTDDWLKIKNWLEGDFPIVGHGETNNGGFVIYVDIDGEEPQKVAVNGDHDRRAIRAGEVGRATVQYLERSKKGRLRKPSYKGAAG